MSKKNTPYQEAVIESMSYLNTADPPRWVGRIQGSGDDRPSKMMVFNLQGEFWALSALCPHECYDLTHCPIAKDNIIVCPAHSLHIDLKTSGFRVKQDGNRFLVTPDELKTDCPKMMHCESVNANFEYSRMVEQLHKEIDKLWLANLKQEKQIHVITKSMDDMLVDSDNQKRKLKEKVSQHQGLTRFVDRIMDTLDVLLFVIDTQGQIRRINLAVENELGFSEKELLGSTIDSFLNTEDQQYLAQDLPQLHWQIQSLLLENIRLHGYYTGEHQLVTKNRASTESIYWLKGNLLHSDQGKLEGAVISAMNITELKNRTIQLRLSDKVFESSREAIFITNPQGEILEINVAFSTITGYKRSEVLYKNIELLKSNEHDQMFYKRIWKTLLKEGFWKGEIWGQRKNGALCPMLLSINAVFDDRGHLSHYAAISTDISQQKQTEEELKQLAYYDVLTGLPNRFLFKDRFEHEILLAKRNNTRLALFFLDLDHFKDINDTIGHWAGDRLLQVVASRIQKCLRKSDTVARLGGDEFTIILSNISDINIASDLARQLVDAVNKPLQIDDYTVYISTSIGIAIFPNDGNNFDTLTKHADTAMYASKAKGRGMFQYFEVGMNELVNQRLLLENALRQAIENEEFQLYYQPKFEYASNSITGAEALIYWPRDGFGIIPPGNFISILEETALIIPLGIWIIRTACLQAKSWASKQPGFRVAINLSPRQLLSNDFIPVLEQILQETKTNPKWIELEITESLIMHDIEKATERLLQIRELGIHITMDDFGTGYSSLSYLQKLPIQTLKIDQSFIQAYLGDPNSNEAAFIKTIVSLGQVLNMTTIAEGIETESQFTLLKSYGCTEIQGFYISPPISAESFESKWL